MNLPEYICTTCLITFEPRTKPSNIERPFCSRSCAAKHNNHAYPKKKKIKETKYCLRCHEHIPANQKFCNNDCQQLYQAKSRVDSWLKSGNLPRVSTHKQSYIKKYLLEQQKYLCAICFIPNLWQEKELILILDHIDGNSENNIRENLRLVCPNCDSQLSTYKGRNKGNGRFKRRVRYIEDKSY